METTTQSDRRGWFLFVSAAILWVFAYFGARAVLEATSLDPMARVAVVLVPVPFFALFLGLIIRGIRSQDEMQRRIHLEALAIAFPAAILLLMTLGLLELAIELKKEDWSYRHVWPFLPMFYFAGLWYSTRRYQ